MPAPLLRIIGDVHGKMEEYIHLASQAPFSVQLGDMGFASHYKYLNDLDPRKHVFIPGNNDDYDSLPPHALGDYGPTSLNGLSFFFVRGAESIDKFLKTEGVDWWSAEELNAEQSHDVLESYKQIKPDVVMSHDCPSFLVGEFARQKYPHPNSNTQQLLQTMWEIHQPRQWYFGHFHMTQKIRVHDTVFTCLGELEYEDIYHTP